jgi:FkbM family methyltransferase
VGVTARLEPRPGWVIRSHPGADRFAYRAQADDPDQAAEFDRFVARCRPGMRLFDLGAHFGLFSLAACHYGGPTARAVAVDPSPLAVRVTRFQARANGLADRLTVRRAAVGRTPGVTRLVAGGIESAGYYVPPADHPASERTAVEMVSIDSLVAELGWPPTHLKIDVEGAEADVLAGGVETLRTAGPEVFLELHTAIIRAAGGDPSEPLRLLAHCGYTVPGGPDGPVVRLVATR